MLGERPIQSDRSDNEHKTLIDQLLAEQRTLTAVTQFSQWHETTGYSTTAKRYRNLIPLSAPKPGEQLAFEVELDRCSGCKACVTACHNLNQLNDHETWRSVGFLHGGDAWRPQQTNVTTACHHCIDAACLNGCPVIAYEKDSLTGIVKHLGDRCMGCQYCTLKCPYEVPQFRKDRGIVRKCDMCSSRLEAGEAPACVQSCPNEAIRIVIVDTRVIAATTTSATELVPGAPKSAYTVPTTQYRAAKPFPSNTQSADETELKLQPGHWPLSWMLVLTQFAVGLICAALFASDVSPVARWTSVIITFAGLSASALHLGKPLRAWRALLNLRKSWLSREIAAFSLLAALVAMTAIIPSQILQSVTAVVGLVAVFASVMIYADTQRTLWIFRKTAAKFFGSTALLGLAGSVVFFKNHSVFIPLLVLVSSLKLALEVRIFRSLDDEAWSIEKKSALLLSQNLRLYTSARLSFGIIGGIVLPAIGFLSDTSQPIATAIFIFCFAGELIERHLFFRAAATPKMPGGVAA